MWGKWRLLKIGVIFMGLALRVIEVISCRLEIRRV